MRSVERVLGAQREQLARSRSRPGTHAVRTIEAKHLEVSVELARWRALALSTDFVSES